MAEYKKWTLEDAKIVIEDIDKFGFADEYTKEEQAHARMLLERAKKRPPKQAVTEPVETAPAAKKGLGNLKSVNKRQQALDAIMME